jgi:hypothetical protein
MTREIVEITDIGPNFATPRTFDLAVFASGYEARARHLASQLNPECAGKIIVLGFQDGQDDDERRRNDEFFLTHFKQVPIVLPSNQPGGIARLMTGELSQHSDDIRILVDISAMARAWYADIINWVRFSGIGRSVEIEFAYSHGKYPGDYPVRRISRTVSLFGFEGRADPRLQTVAFLGLGYDAITPMAILEDLQPEHTFGFVATSSDGLSLSNAVAKNAGTIEQLDGPLAVIPIDKPSIAFRTLTEMVAPHVGMRNIVFITLGPKTHVLASLLVSTVFDEITCLHAQGGPEHPFNVVASGTISGCRLKFAERLEMEFPSEVNGALVSAT